MLNTRWWLAVLAVVVAACASSSRSGIAVSVAELRERGRHPPAVGDHYYRIRITNRSSESIVVESIHIEPAGMTELDVEDATEQFDDTIGPDDTRTFEMQFRVRSSRATSERGAFSFTASIESLRVMVIGRNEKGPFTDSGDYSVGAELFQP